MRPRPRGMLIGPADPNRSPSGAPSEARRASLTLAAVCVWWGTIPVVTAWSQLPAVSIAFSRVSIAAAALGLALWVEGRVRPGADAPRPFSVARGQCIAAAAVLAVHWVSLFAAYQRTSPGTVILIVYLAPVGIAALAPRMLGERLGPRTIAAVGLGVVGVALVAAPALEGAAAGGVAYAGLAAATFVALILLSKPLSETYGGLRLTLIEMAGATVFLLPLAMGAPWGEPNRRWSWLLVSGLLHTALGTGIYLAALARVPATAAGILGYLEPVSVVLFSWWLLSETPRLSTVAGGVLILAAAVLTVTQSAMNEVERVPG